MDIFEMNRILLGEESSWFFLLEVAFRTIIMYAVLLTALRLTGKKEVRQLSVFELVLIVGLGSAGGDPMFYSEVGILPATMVFLTMIGLYILTNFITLKNRKLEKLIEGSSKCIYCEGKIQVDVLNKERISHAEFFADLRGKNISQLGQVKLVYLEFSGQISVFFFEDHEVGFGLPILPYLYKKQQGEINETDYYSCGECGNTHHWHQTQNFHCANCGCKQYVKSLNEKRIT